MYGIFVNNGNDVLRAASSSDREMFVGRGWRELTQDEITAAGMGGYEQFVSPLTATVNADGSITFTPPAPPSSEELFTSLRTERDMLISAVLWMRERHADELELGKETTLTPEQYTALLTYIQALRDLPVQPGAPWDGGGELTPWPELPEV